VTTTSKLSRTLLVAFTASIALAACKPSTPDPEATAPAAAAATTPADTAPAAAASNGPAAPVPTTLTALDEASRSASIERTGMCSFDLIDGVKVEANVVAHFQNPASSKIEGWVADMASMSHPEDARLRLENADRSGVWEVGFGTPVSRPDVAKYYKSKALTDSGFSLTTDLSSLPAGVYRVSAVHNSNGHPMMCVGPQVAIGG
jgi:hypothetical protein